MTSSGIRPYLLIGAAAVAALFCLTPWGKQLNLATYDTYVFLRGERQLPDNIVFVAIDEASFAQVGLQWPWPRALHAKLLNNLYAGGAKTVAVDILFTEASTPDDDGSLAAVLNQYGTTVLAADVSVAEDNRFNVETTLLPLTMFRTPLSRVGHVRTPNDADGFVRRADLQLKEFESFALASARAYSDERCCTDLPVAKQPLIDFAGGPGSVNTVSYYQALDPEKYLPPDTFRNKLIIVGVNTSSSAMPDERRPDHFPIPFTRWGSGYAPGSIIHANIAANLLSGSFIKASRLPLVALAGCLIAIAFGIGTLNMEFRRSSLIALVSGLIILTASFMTFVNAGYYLAPAPLLLPLLVAFLVSPYYRYLAEARQRAFIRKAFSTYVNPVIVSELEKNPASIRLGGKQVDGTALFLDIAGFTALSERHSPETIVNFINEFLSRLIDIAMKHEGTVERFLGDAIMVIWGAPVEQPDHAQRACRAAVEMAREIEDFAAQEANKLGAAVSARIGINSGSMTAGNIGANRRFNYTVLGDCVNLAARLESLNKIYGTTTIVGEATATALGPDFVLRRLDMVTVKGRRQPETIYELVGNSDSVSRPQQQALADYETGLKLYLAKQWTAAAESFAAVLAVVSDDRPAALLLQRCTDYADMPPPDEWQGVSDITEK